MVNGIIVKVAIQDPATSTNNEEEKKNEKQS